MTSNSGADSNRSNSQLPSVVGRRCTRSGCLSNAVMTLTYIYADSSAVLAPLSTFVEPHAYDLCEQHSEKLTVPKGWSVIQNKSDLPAPKQSTQDILAIAEAIRQVAKQESNAQPLAPEIGRRGHLRSIPKQD
ncbi:MAG: hypothetical protein RL694_393 [Actinomycetota bacterium]|jgi:hypothetical protein